MRKAVLLTSTASAAALMMSAALAEDEIIVTATKREQTLQEVPVAVSVVQEETLERAQIVDVIDLQSVVPALRVSQLERSSNATFIIRGFGNGSNNAGIEPSVAVFVDGVFRTRVGSALDDFINLERIEVLKGPQSTLFGKNASAGVVSVVTKKPSFEWQGAVEGTLGNYNSRIAKGYVTGPINDMFAFSLSGSINKRDGYFENLGDSGDFNNRDRYSLRGQILAQPTEDLEFRVIADYSEIDERCCGTFRQTDGTGPIIRDSLGALTPEPGAFDYTIANDFENRNEISNQGISVQADWDINDDNKLTYISAFRRYDDLVDFEGDFTTATILGTNIRSIDTDTITQELRLAGQKDRISYLIGGFYFYEDLDVGDTVLYGSDARPYVDNVAALLAGFVGPDGTPIPAASPLNTVEALLGLPVGQTFYQDGAGVGFNATQKDQQFQIFAQADFEITDRLTFTAGVAYFQADKEVTFRDIERSNSFSDVNLVELGFESFIFPIGSGSAATPANIAALQASDPARFAALTQASITTNEDAVAAGATPGTLFAVDPNTGLPASNGLLEFFPDLQPLGPITPFPNSVESGETSDNDVPYTLRLAYDATERTNIYASYATGFKASSWNLSLDSRPFAADVPGLFSAGELALDGANGNGAATPTGLALQLAGIPNQYSGTRFAGPEETRVYEIGLKSRFSFGSLNVALFDQSVEGFQSSIFQGTGFVLANAGEQSARGIEFDAVITPPTIEGLTLSLSGLYVDAEYDEFNGAAVLRGSPQDLVDGIVDGVGSLSGQRPAGVPDFAGSFGFDYRRNFLGKGDWFLRADFQYETDVQVVDNIPEDILSRQVAQLNASAGIDLDSGLELLLWGRNITNDEFPTSGFPTTLQNFPSQGIIGISGYPNVPRTYGVTVRKRW